MIAALPNPELQIADLIQSLTRRVDDGHSQWIAYRYYRHAGDDQRADEILSAAATLAAERLEKEIPRTAGNQASGEEGGGGQAGDEDSEDSVDRKLREKLSWDAMIVMAESELLIRNKQYNAAAEYLRRLTQLQHSRLPPDLVERAYLDYGQTWLSLGDPVKASETWKSGVEQMGGEPLDLLRASTAMLVYEGEDLNEALAALKQFDSGIDRATVRLARSSEADLQGTSRNALSSKVNEANWHLTVVRGKYAERKNAFDTAIGLYEDALRSSVKVPNAMRVQVAVELANLHGKRGIWDQAGLALDKAVALAPDDQSLRSTAARAWLRAGNRTRALRHRREAETSESFTSLLASAEAQLAYQLRLLPSQRDISGIRALIGKAEELLNDLAEQNPEKRKEILAESWRQKVLVAYLPPEGVELDDHVQSASLAKDIARIAESDPINHDLQAFAAVRLTAIDHPKLGKECLDRLVKIDAADATHVALVKASVAAIEGRFVDAAVLLVTRSRDDEENATQLLNQAAEYAVSGNHPELAYRAILAVPADQRDVPLLRKLASLARGLPSDSAVLKRDGETVTPVQLSTRWENALRSVEGENGTYWRFARASTLVVQVYQNPNEKTTNAARLEEVEKLTKEIRARRPAWGPGIALGGWLAALRGETEEAVSLLRRGIDAGDQRIQSRMLLVEQLNKLARFEEAEAELQLAGQSVGAAPESVPQLAVELAQRQGDYRRSVVMARLTVQTRENDPSAYQLLAQALSMAATKSRKRDEKNDLIAEARQALEKAGELSDGPDHGLFAALLQFEFTHGDRKSQQRALDAIAQSSLPERLRVTLLSQAYLAQGDMAKAGEALRRVAELTPSDTRAHMNLAKFYQMTRQPEKSIRSIETAYRLDPGDGKIRNQLALALALQGGADIPWDRLNSLLGGSGGIEGTADGRLLHGLLLAQRGGQKQQEQAAEMLQQLIDEGGNRSLEATRVLASLNRLRWFKHVQRESSDQAQRWLDEAKGLYELLVRRRDPEPIDLYRYADLLLTAEQPHDVQRLLLALESVDRAAVAELDIRLRYNETTDDPEPADKIIMQWGEKVSAKGAIEPQQLNKILGFHFDASRIPGKGHPAAADRVQKESGQLHVVCPSTDAGGATRAGAKRQYPTL